MRTSAAKRRSMIVTERTIGRYVRKFNEDEIQTRLALFMMSRGVKPAHLARESNTSRQHLLRVRKGTMDITRGKMARLVSAARRIVLEPVRPEDLFELVAEEGGTWALAPDRDRVIRAAAAYAAEFNAAEYRVADLAKLPVAKWKQQLITHPSGVTVPLVRLLLRTAYKQLDSDSARANEIYALVFELTESLPQSVLPDLKVTIRGLCYLYRAYVGRQMGKYADAMALLDRAEHEVEGTSYCATELAQVWYERAAVLFKSGDLERAEREARRSATLFTVLGDVRRVARAHILLGSVAYERGDIATARVLWLRAIEPLRAAEDHDAVASLTMNIGAAEMLLGNVADAKGWLDRAHRMFTKLGVRSEIIRVRWTRAKLRLLHENRADGLRLLRAVRSDYLSAKMPVEAGFVGLDMVEALLEDRAASDDELIGLARAVVSAFEDAGATPKMLHALTCLRQAVQRHKADVDLVGDVRAYLHEALRGTVTTFVPRSGDITASGSTKRLPGR